MLRPLALVLLAASAPLACVTVPSDAPPQFHAARQALEVAKDSPAARTLPHTLKRADVAYDEALRLLKHARNKEGPSPLKDELLDAASAKASEAGSLAAHAVVLSRRIDGWDERVEGYFEEEVVLHSVFEMLSESLVAGGGREGCVTPKVGLVTRVAFFDPGTDELSDRDMPSIASLAEFLLAEPAVKVRLVGHADAAGPSGINKHLARRRAEQVAEALSSAGVDPERIELATQGEFASADEGAPAEAKALDRHVEAQILGEEAAVSGLDGESYEDSAH